VLVLSLPSRTIRPQDYERFLEDVDMDPELRQRVNVYKDPARFRITDDGAVVPPPRCVPFPPPETHEHAAAAASSTKTRLRLFGVL
jgi:hypothetical protein